jgi:hypothetical protein
MAGAKIDNTALAMMAWVELQVGWAGEGKYCFGLPDKKS